MKIALFVPSWPPGILANGIVTYASQLVPALRRLGHEVYVLTPLHGAGDEDPRTIDLQPYFSKTTPWDRLMFKLFPDTHFFNRASAAITAPLRQLVQGRKLDVFEMEESVGCSLTVSRLNLLPVVVRLHGPWFLNGASGNADYGSFRDRRREQREGLGISAAQIVTSPSAMVLQAVKDRYGLKLNESKVIPNPVQAACAKEVWNIATCRRDTLLFVGHIDKRKGTDLLLRAFANLAARNPKLKLILVGPDKGIKESRREPYSVDEFIRVHIPEALRSRIEVLGPVRHPDIAVLRMKSFATIVPSRYEIMPYSVLEAMSLGCPLIATAVGGIPELIKDDRNGILIPSEDASAITSACQKLLDDPALAARLGRQAWQDCQESFNPEKIAKQTISTYQEAIDAFNSLRAPLRERLG